MKPQIKFTKRMQALFGAPDATIAAEVIAEYVNALEDYTEAELKRAGDKIAKTRRIRAWPTVAECIDAAEDARRNPADVNLKVIGNFDKWWEERLSRIATASDEAGIADQLEMIRPYAEAKWIAPWHWQEATAAAERRRKAWKSDHAAKVALRMIGEGGP